MSDALTPGQDAKARIHALGQQTMLAFFGEIPADTMQQVARFLPSIDGFRKTSEAGIAKQKEVLARKLSRTGADERDYHGLYLIWRSWIDANFPNAKLAHELIDSVEDAADAAHNAEDRRLAVEKHVDSLLEKLKDESQQNRCTREQIDRLFTFSPFPETAAARGLIAAAKPASEVDRDTELSELPKRLRHDEDEIQSIKAALKALSTRLDPLTASVETAFAKLPELEAGIAKVHTIAEGARNALYEEIKRAQAAEAAKPGANIDDGRAALEASVKAIAGEVDAVSSELRKLSSSLSAVDELREAIEQVATDQKTSAENLQSQYSRIEELSSALKQIGQAVAVLSEDRALVEQLAALGERLSELEKPKSVALPKASPPYETKDLTIYQGSEVLDLRSNLRWESLQAINGSTPAAIRSYADVAGAFVKALQPLGLRKTTGQIFAEECAAAILSRQVIFLKGAFAARVARGLARAVAGPASARLAIPIGMQDAEELRFCIATALGRYPQHIGAFAIEGVNLTAIDLTGEVLSDCVDRPANASDGRGGRAAIFATIAGGIASLPIEGSYFELGPVFDLDYLDWRTSQPTEPEPAGSVLSIEADLSIQGQLGSGGANTEEAIRLARLHTRKRNPAIERTFVRAYQALHISRSDQKVVTPLHSLCYGWLLPYWRTLNLSKDQIDSELDGGKCNGTVPDPRLAGMLAADFVDDEKSDGLA